MFIRIIVFITSSIFNISWVVLGVKAYYIQNWKHLSIACSAPYAILLFSYFVIPESVRWLHLQQRNDDAIKVLQKIARWNKLTIPENFTLATSSPDVSPVYQSNINILAQPPWNVKIKYLSTEKCL